MDSSELNKKLAALQKGNLQFSETWLNEFIDGVNVIKTMSYYFIQHLNHATLKELLEEKKSE